MKEKIFNELLGRVTHCVINYRTDLDIDKVIMSGLKDGTPFIHVARESGTHMYVMYPHDSECWPGPLEKVRYLFGKVDRVHILKQKASINYHQTNHPNAIYTYFDGVHLSTINATRAIEIIDAYIERVLKEWRELAKSFALNNGYITK